MPTRDALGLYGANAEPKKYGTDFPSSLSCRNIKQVERTIKWTKLNIPRCSTMVSHLKIAKVIEINILWIPECLSCVGNLEQRRVLEINTAGNIHDSWKSCTLMRFDILADEFDDP